MPVQPIVVNGTFISFYLFCLELIIPKVLLEILYSIKMIDTHQFQPCLLKRETIKRELRCKQKLSMLKIINTVLKTIILKQIVWETQIWY